MRLHQRSISKVTLISVLKRRKSNLKRFLAETGIVTYELLKTRCDSMGVIPPEEQEFIEALGSDVSGTASVSSPAEGLIVLDPPKIINELTGKEVTMPTIVTQDDQLENKNEKTAEISDQADSEESSSKKKKKRS